MPTRLSLLYILELIEWQQLSNFSKKYPHLSQITTKEGKPLGKVSIISTISDETENMQSLWNDKAPVEGEREAMQRLFLPAFRKEDEWGFEETREDPEADPK